MKAEVTVVAPAPTGQAGGAPGNMSAEELEEFRRFQEYRRQQQAQPAAVALAPHAQPQPVAVPSYPAQQMVPTNVAACPTCRFQNHVAPGSVAFVCGNCHTQVSVVHQQTHVVLQGAAAAPVQSRCCSHHCCSVECSLLTCTVFSGISMVIALSMLIMGFIPYDLVAFMILTPGFVLMIPNIVTTAVAGAEVGCYRYCSTCCTCSGCFGDRPRAKPAFNIMVASLVLGGVGYLMLTQTWTCLLSYNYQYSIRGYCAFVGAYMMMVHVLSFTSNVLFLKYWRYSTKPKPAAPGIQLQSVQTSAAPAPQQYPVAHVVQPGQQ